MRMPFLFPKIKPSHYRKIYSTYTPNTPVMFSNTPYTKVSSVSAKTSTKASTPSTLGSYKSYTSVLPVIDSQTEKEEKNNSTNFVELFGIKLESDDLLILGILFFLYSEGVKDEMLYVILLILLIN